MNLVMVKNGKNNLCPCGSGKKYKNCCLNKKPREKIVMAGSRERLRGFYYDKDKMELMGVTLDGRLIKLDETFSQTHYIGQSGKEKPITRVQVKVIPNEADLMRFLSSLDMVIAVDTNTKIIESETVSVTGIEHCVVQETPDPVIYEVDFPWHGAFPFRNCPSDLPPEKYGWMAEIRKFTRDPLNKTKKAAIVTDHDLDNHTSYKNKQLPIFRDFYLPDNITLMYGRSDSSTESLLNDIVKKCDKKSTEVLREIEKNLYYQHGDEKISITQIPMPSL